MLTQYILAGALAFGIGKSIIVYIKKLRHLADGGRAYRTTGGAGSTAMTAGLLWGVIGAVIGAVAYVMKLAIG